ncbi:MAG: aminotransferase class V-fold PLP-dependent enzyme [Chthoniobacterales bacterium]
MSRSLFFENEAARHAAFPVSAERIFLGHGGVTALPQCVADAMSEQIKASCLHHQEFGEVLRDIHRARVTAADFIAAKSDEIALLGPTSLGLSLFANGIDWQPNDEVVVYLGDYPANAYPWMNLKLRGVKIRFLEPKQLGRITPELVEAALTPKTRLVALASCHFLTGWRINIEQIGKLLHERGILFSLDAIQTLGAFETRVEYVDFLSADAHKWMLGPLSIGIVYVARKHFETCRPTLLGAWNVKSPDFITQEEIEFVDSAQRYEPGVLNVPGIYGMLASLKMLQSYGQATVSERILKVRDYLEDRLREEAYLFLSPDKNEDLRSGILTARHATRTPEEEFAHLEKNGVVASLRSEKSGQQWLRFSPHFYNTIEEMDRVVELLCKK